MLDSYKWGDSWSTRRSLHSEKKISILDKTNFLSPPPKKHNTIRSYKFKYLSNGTWGMVTSGVIRDQLAELYILKKNFDFRQKYFFSLPSQKNFIYPPIQKNQKVLESHETYKYQVSGRNSKKNFHTVYTIVKFPYIRRCTAVICSFWIIFRELFFSIVIF